MKNYIPGENSDEVWAGWDHGCSPERRSVTSNTAGPLRKRTRPAKACRRQRWSERDGDAGDRDVASHTDTPGMRACDLRLSSGAGPHFSPYLKQGLSLTAAAHEASKLTSFQDCDKSGWDNRLVHPAWSGDQIRCMTSIYPLSCHLNLGPVCEKANERGIMGRARGPKQWDWLLTGYHFSHRSDT